MREGGRPIASVVIPAHDEEAVIGRTLRAMLADAEPGELEIAVGCNGCTDATAEIARSFDGVRVVETATAAKPAGLNLAEAAVTAFPRLFVDADVVVGTRDLRAVAAALRDPGALAAAPRLELDLEGASTLLRGYYRIWRHAGWASDGMLGSGFYGVSQAGRARFGAFPDIIADDLFIHSLFAPGERRTVRDARMVVRPPRTVRQLVRTRTRVFAGNWEFRERFPEARLPRSDGPGVLRSAARRPGLWPSAVVYFGVQGVAKSLGRRRHRTGTATWNRDPTARRSA